MRPLASAARKRFFNDLHEIDGGGGNRDDRPTAFERQAGLRLHRCRETSQSSTAGACARRGISRTNGRDQGGQEIASVSIVGEHVLRPQRPLRDLHECSQASSFERARGAESAPPRDLLELARPNHQQRRSVTANFILQPENELLGAPGLSPRVTGPKIYIR